MRPKTTPACRESYTAIRFRWKCIGEQLPEGSGIRLLRRRKRRPLQPRSRRRRSGHSGLPPPVHPSSTAFIYVSTCFPATQTISGLHDYQDCFCTTTISKTRAQGRRCTHSPVCQTESRGAAEAAVGGTSRTSWSTR